VASIERTAYPRFKPVPNPKELNEVYTPTLQEIAFAKGATRSPAYRFKLLVLLKAFQRLGYFPKLEEIPEQIVQHIQICLRLQFRADLDYNHPRQLYRHHQLIRTYLKVIPYGAHARHIAVRAAYQAAQVMNHPADLINVAIEELIKESCELPAFKTLDELSQRVRSLVNRQLFEMTLQRLSPDERQRLEQLLELDPHRRRSQFSALKQSPKRATVSHLRQLQTQLAWLLEIANTERLLQGVPNSKVKHLAAEARVLDVNDIRELSLPKRCTLLVCLLHQTQVETRDHVVEMFLKRMSRIHLKGKEELEQLRERHRTMTESLIGVLTDILQTVDEHQDDGQLAQQLRELLVVHGGTEALRLECEAITAYSGNNYLPLLWKFYRSHRSAMFEMLHLLDIRSTTQDKSLVEALEFLLANEHRRGERLPSTINLDFASEQWRRLVFIRQGENSWLARRPLEICVFSYLATELRTGDLCVRGSFSYADYREQLLSWQECEPMVADYCRQLGFAPSAQGFVQQLKQWLTQTAEVVDRVYPQNGQVAISTTGNPVLKRILRQEPPAGARRLELALQERLPERNLLDVLANVQHWTEWARHFGPASGSDPKLTQSAERYIFTTFSYGCNLGPTQTARHTRGRVTPHMLSFANRQHISASKIDAALRDIINCYNRFSLPKLWGTGKTAAADGTKFALYEENLLSEYHIRYGGYGGIAYHHISDTYIALFSHFIACGVWEAVYIIDGLLKNKSDIQPDTLHADTQGQSTPVFGLAHLLGIKLMPRIRNWQDLIFYRPSREAIYEHIEPLFGDVIDWQLLETHWQDLLRVVLSIQAGKVLPSTLLRKLGNYSRKNRLYQAFRELGRVVRTVFLLQYISDLKLRQQITACTNKVEAYNGFSKWLFFGGDGVISENDP